MSAGDKQRMSILKFESATLNWELPIYSVNFDKFWSAITYLRLMHLKLQKPTACKELKHISRHDRFANRQIVFIRDSNIKNLVRSNYICWMKM